MVATSATIIPAPSSHQHPTLSIPVQTQQKPSEPPADSMSLIVQLGTTSVGYTPPTFNTSVGTAAVSNHGATSAASRMVSTNQIQVAKHRLPMTINRQPQQHSLPVRNIAALARPIQQAPVMANTPSTMQAQNQNTMPVVAGRVLASPVKDASLDDDLLEGVVEKRPKYHKHLPLNYQYVLQDHNYGAPPPPTPPAVSPSKSPINGMPASNGISVAHSHGHGHSHIHGHAHVHTHIHTHGHSYPHIHPHAHTHSHSHVHVRSPPIHSHLQPNNYSSSLLYNNSKPVSNISSVPNEIESDVSSDGEREVEPEGEETETAPEGEGDLDDEDSVTRCICDFQHDDGYMICCDRCSVWQHVDCMGIDRGNIPDEYLCEKCQPRRVEKQRAIALQIRKRRELFDTSDSSSETSSSSDNPAVVKPAMRKRAVVARRRSEPVRKPSISSTAKPRRESAKEMSNCKMSSARQNNRQTNRKRHVEKRLPARRKNSTMSNSLHNSNNSSHAEKKNSSQSASSLVSTTTSSSSSSSLSSSSTSSLTSDKANHHNDKNITSPNSSGSSGDSVQQLRQWIDSYEEAVTNHYSPELRARIGSIKVNGIHSDLRLPSNLLATPKCRISLLPSGIKILMTCVNVVVNQPLIELRGKYMLCGNSGPGLTNRPPRPAAPPPPGPHIFHYKLPRDNTEVCVDCRTYGNDARFVRRSCQPNAEIRHCIEKGTLHLYLVTTSPVDKNSEVTIAYTPNCGVPCICGNKDCCIKKEKELTVTRDSPSRNQEKKNGVLKVTNNVAPSSNSQSTVEKRRRGRRRTASENQSEEKTRATEKTTPIKQNSSSVNSTSTEKPQSPPSPPSPPLLPPLTRSAASSGSRPNKITSSLTNNNNSTRNLSPSVNSKKEETTKSSSNNSNTNNGNNNNNNITNNNNNNNSKTNNNNSSNHNNNNNNSNSVSNDEVNNKKNIVNNSNISQSDKKDAADKKKKMTREERKLEAIMKAFERMEKDQAKRETLHRQAQQRKDSTDAEKEKQLTVAETKASQIKEKEREEQPASNNKTSSIRKRRRKGRGRSHPMIQPTSRARARRAVRRSRNSSTNSRTIANHQEATDSEHSTDNDMDSDSQSAVKPSTNSNNVSQAADLLMSLSTPNNHADEKENEDGGMYTRSSSYQNDNKDPVDEHTEEDDDDDNMQRLNCSTSSSDTPPTPLSKTCLVVAAAVGSLAPGFKFPKTKKGLLNTWFKAPDPGSPPSVPAPDDSPTRPGPGKKRWLRQAISEECESPNRPELSVSPTDYVAPLKKRRLARESISSELSFTPPATPVEPVSQLNFEDEEEEQYGRLAVKREYDENDGGCSSESDTDLPAGPRTPNGPEPKSEADSMKEEKNTEAEENHVDDKCMIVEVKEVKEEVKAKIERDDNDRKEKKSTPARKKVLSISEYRQRKMQGGRESHDGEIDGEEADGPESGNGNSNMVTSSPRSHSSESSSMSSSDEEESHSAIAKSLLLDVNTGAPKPGAGTSRFSCAPTLVERQRENLTERLKREFGLFLSDDEENMAARRQSLSNDLQLQPVQLSSVITTPVTTVSTAAEKKEGIAPPINEKEKEKRKKPPPPPPPLPVSGLPLTGYPMYPGYMTGVRGPSVYPQAYGIPPPLPPPALEPVNVGSAAPYYGPPNSYYGQLPHSH